MTKRYENFGRLMKGIRIEHGLTQAQMAKLIGVHGQFISNCETHKCALPKPKVKMLIKKLKISPRMQSLLIHHVATDAYNHARREWSDALKVGG